MHVCLRTVPVWAVVSTNFCDVDRCVHLVHVVQVILSIGVSVAQRASQCRVHLTYCDLRCGLFSWSVSARVLSRVL